MQLGLGLAIDQVRDESFIIGSDKRIDNLTEWMLIVLCFQFHKMDCKIPAAGIKLSNQGS